MIATWLRELLDKARRKEPAQARENQELPLTDFWIDQMLQSESDCIYEVSRTEPFRLRHVRASEAPVTPALINHTVRTILGIMEPGQPHLGREFCQALRTSRRTHRPNCAINRRTTASAAWPLSSIWGRNTTGFTCIAAPMILVMGHRSARRSNANCSRTSKSAFRFEQRTCRLRIPRGGVAGCRPFLIV